MRAMKDSAQLEWLLTRQLDGEVTEAELRELQELLRDDAEARAFYVRHCQMHAMLGAEPAALGAVEEREAADNVIRLPVSEIDDAGGGSRRSIAERTRWSALRLSLVGAVAAGIVLAVFVGRVVFAPPTEEEAGVARNRAAELVHETALSDGSTVELATRSVVSIRYTEGERALELKDGEAHFTVAHDEQRPFVVTAGAVRVEAVGTAFDVRRAAERVVVTVIEGKVKVSRGHDGSSESVAQAAKPVETLSVPAGNQVRWDAAEPGAELTAVDPSQALSWRQGRLEYSDEPLWAVLADLRRYHDRPITLEKDKGLERLAITGTVLTDAIPEFLSGLSRSLPVRVENEEGAWRILPGKQKGAP